MNQTAEPCEHARGWVDYLTAHGLDVDSEPPGQPWRLICYKCSHFYRVKRMQSETGH